MSFYSQSIVPKAISFEFTTKYILQSYYGPEFFFHICIDIHHQRKQTHKLYFPSEFPLAAKTFDFWLILHWSLAIIRSSTFEFTSCTLPKARYTRHYIRCMNFQEQNKIIKKSEQREKKKSTQHKYWAQQVNNERKTHDKAKITMYTTTEKKREILKAFAFCLLKTNQLVSLASMLNVLSNIM